MKILVPNALDGKIPLMLKEKYPDSEISCLEYFPFYVDWLKSLGFKVINLNRDITRIEKELKNMRFDLILGNPPYQDEFGSGNALWSQFVYDSLNLLSDKGYIFFITPGRWVLPGNNIKKGQIRLMDEFKKINPIYFNLGKCSEYFNAGSSSDYFSMFLIQNSQYNGRTKIETNDEVFNVDMRTIDWIPYTSPSELSISIVNKIFRSNDDKFKFVWKYERNHISLKDKVDNDYKFPLFLGNNKFKFSKFKSDLVEKKKVIFKLGRFITYNKRLFIDYKGEISYNSAYVFILKVNQNVDYLFSKLFSFLGNSLYNGSEITSGGLNSFPLLDTSRSWTDQELYDHFNLTQEEIDLVEKSV